MSLGCGAIVVILLSILVAGMFEVDRGMRLIAERAQERVLELLPHELDPKQRQEIARGMERLLEEAEHASEGGDIISSFVRVVGSLVEDGRLTAEEIDQLDLFLKGSKSDPTVRAD
ncbi:MAG: hypothetical protein GY906_18815 [bacterium]|nr:hypothetical protein [bacterium]